MLAHRIIDRRLLRIGDTGPEADDDTVRDRLTPILMTSLVTGLALLPLALGSGEPGREIEGPMAVVILGGLLTSMALNLLVLPILALRYGRFEPVHDEFAAVSPSTSMPAGIAYEADD